MLMQIACGCCLQLRAVTIKCIDKTDGTTIWEYGPGSLWRHHYGADAISGVVPDLAATLDKYAIAAGSHPSYNACGNRNAATLAANVCEALSVVKLDSLDGTTIESATLTGLFCDVITDTSVGLVSGQTMTNAAALSGGDFVIVGERVPFIEFSAFASNGATKEYILHAHGLQSGNVYLKTRTSDETITIPYDSTAAEVETLFEATSDCTAATVTGGPWPLLPITVEATWSVSSGDISAIAVTGNYSASSEPVIWSHEFGSGSSIRSLSFVITKITVGVEFDFTFPGGAVFSYTSLTDDPNTYIAALGAAMATFVAANTGLVSGDDPGEVQWTDNVLTVYFLVDDPADELDPQYVGGGDTVSTTRRAGMCAASYDTGTGEMTSAVGFEFGYSEDNTPLKMFAETAALPTTTGLNVLGIASIGSGPSDDVVITPLLRGLGDGIRASTVERWSIAAGEWTREWQVYCNATINMPSIIYCESGYVVCPIRAKRFDSVRDRTAARIAVADSAIVEIETTYGSITAPDNQVLTAMYDGTPGSYFSWDYDIVYQDQGLPNNRFRINGHGADTYINGTEFRIGAQAFGCDGTAVFATNTAGISGGWHYDGIGDSTDSDLVIRYFAPPTSRAAEPQQFRFKVNNMTGTNYTSWLDWYSTEAEIETALNALLGTGNCSILSFGAVADPIENVPLALIECNPYIEFKTDNGFTPGSGRIPIGYFSFRNDGVFLGTNDIVIEMQTITPFADPPGIAAFDATDASLIWSRAFGTALVGSTTVESPLYAWLQGDYVYAYGQLLENELP